MVIIKLKNLMKNDSSYHAYRGRNIDTIIRRVYGPTAVVRDLSDKHKGKAVYMKINAFVRKVGLIQSETESGAFKFPNNMDNLKDLLFDFKEHTCKYCSNYERKTNRCMVDDGNVSKCLCKNGVAKFLSCVR
ncbi:MAG: hypothetical protein LBM02_07115 [Lachnospiraceae bacterium]|nr:hypothetical protein [Lachnospiraceae bacterium]